VAQAQNWFGAWVPRGAWGLGLGWRQKPPVGARTVPQHPLLAQCRIFSVMNEMSSLVVMNHAPGGLGRHGVWHTLAAGGLVPDYVMTEEGPCTRHLRSNSHAVKYGDFPDWFISGSFTVGVRVRITADAGLSRYICGDYDGGSNSSFVLRASAANRFQFWWENPAGTAPAVTGAVAVTLAQWYTVMATWDGTTRRLYVDGAADGTEATAQGRADVGLSACAGRAGEFNGGHFTGELGWFGLWGRQLSAVEAFTMHADPYCVFENLDRFDPIRTRGRRGHGPGDEPAAGAGTVADRLLRRMRF